MIVTGLMLEDLRSGMISSSYPSYPSVPFVRFSVCLAYFVAWTLDRRYLRSDL